VWLMYFEDPKVGFDYTHSMSKTGKFLISTHGLLLLGLGILPAPILYFCLRMLS
jgi:hypothetical protein